MPVQPVRLFGDLVLRARAAEVVDFDEEPRDLLDTMAQIRQARWLGTPEPVAELSPYPLLGKVR